MKKNRVTLLVAVPNHARDDWDVSKEATGGTISDGVSAGDEVLNGGARNDGDLSTTGVAAATRSSHG